MDESDIRSVHSASELLQGSLTLMRAQLVSRGIELNISGGKDIQKVKVNPNRIEQVFINILGNARDAVSAIENPKIDIFLSSNDVSVVISFCDNGMGIEKHQLNKVMEPFYTSKSVGEGTGLGLSISYNIIKSVDGELNIESTEGVGTSVTVILPIYSQPVLQS